MRKYYVIIQHPKITVRIQDEVLALRTYYNSYLGADKARSASGRPALIYQCSRLAARSKIPADAL